MHGEDREKRRNVNSMCLRGTMGTGDNTKTVTIMLELQSLGPGILKPANPLISNKQ